MQFNEDFLHYIWKYKRFNHRNLTTIDGTSLFIQNYGIHNHNSGPDFHNAKITINETQWAGNVEIHIKSSDWNRHKHQNDKAYDNVILHIVYEYDQPVYNSSGQELPTIELKDRIEEGVIENYQHLMATTSWIPCANQISEVDQLILLQAIDSALIQRLQRKAKIIEESWNYYHKDWNKTCYQSIASSLGAKINKEPFEHLARITPLEILIKSSDQLFKLEAVLLGQAGLLGDESQDEYHQQLITEYQFQKHKHQLQSMKRASWHFSGLRPASFPHIRIVQFAKIIFNHPTLFSKLKTIATLPEIDKIFDISLDGYWMTHYNFDKESKSKNKSIGQTVRRNLVINSIVPILFSYADKMKDEQMKERALNLLQSVPAESNSIIKNWNKLGLKSDSAHDTQGLLELKNESCTFKKCLNCPIGIRLLKSQGI